MLERETGSAQTRLGESPCGFESHPGHLVDPVTGLSRRQHIAIGLLIPLGIVGSTIATLVDERGDDLCPDQAYECATLESGEPIVIGVVHTFPEPDLEAMRFPRIQGHPVRVDVRVPGCSARAAAEDVRELASDPPDGPPAVLVIAATCDAAVVPMAQILSDSGITLVSTSEAQSAPTSPPYHLVSPPVDVAEQLTGLQSIGSASHLRDLLAKQAAGPLQHAIAAIERVAIRKDDQLLIPRTPLRDAMIAEGYERAG